MKDAPPPPAEATSGNHKAEAAAAAQRAAVKANTHENQTPTPDPGPHTASEQGGLGGKERNRQPISASNRQPKGRGLPTTPRPNRNSGGLGQGKPDPRRGRQGEELQQGVANRSDNSVDRTQPPKDEAGTPTQNTLPTIPAKAATTRGTGATIAAEGG